MTNNQPAGKYRTVAGSNALDGCSVFFYSGIRILLPHACYYMGLFFRGDVDNEQIDFRYIGLHRAAGYLGGVESADEPPHFNLPAKRNIKEKYVRIAGRRSSQAKYWNNPCGWDEGIAFLHENGDKVVCIDKEKIPGTGLIGNKIPWGVDIDDTGDKPLQERIDMIKDTDFFIRFFVVSASQGGRAAFCVHTFDFRSAGNPDDSEKSDISKDQ